ncbi:MAG: NAD(P)-dependent oxidoreductase, partial [Pseudomonadota bacterium]
LSRADFSVITIPASTDTHHLINAELLTWMPTTAHLINVARGDIVDEAALIKVLERRQIAGAGLDVYEHEPRVPDTLKKLENAVLLPHMGTSTLEVREDMGRVAIENLRAALAGEVPPNLVN